MPVTGEMHAIQEEEKRQEKPAFDGALSHPSLSRNVEFCLHFMKLQAIPVFTAGGCGFGAVLQGSVFSIATRNLCMHFYN